MARAFASGIHSFLLANRRTAPNSTPGNDRDAFWSRETRQFAERMLKRC